MPAILRKLVLEFTKMSGAGNDFIVLDNRFYYFTDTDLSDLAQRFCPRRTGIGADGLLALSPPADLMNQYRMRYFNADGSVGTMCGNGARCLARFARNAGLGRGDMTFESDAGLHRVSIPDESDGPVRLFLNEPQDLHLNQSLAGGLPEGLSAAHFIWTGTEHVVCFVDDVAVVPVDTWGERLRYDAALEPHGANVNFVQVQAPSAEEMGPVLRVRTYEKGVEAETQACGTGAVAAALLAYQLGHVAQQPITVKMPGGALQVGFATDDPMPGAKGLYLEGPADFIYRGSVEV